MSRGGPHSFIFQKDNTVPGVEGEADEAELKEGSLFSRLWLHPGRRRCKLPCKMEEVGRIPSSNSLTRLNSHTTPSVSPRPRRAAIVA